MKCNGKCYLKKQLNKAEEKSDSESKNTTTKENHTDIIHFIVADRVHIQLITYSQVIVENDYYTDILGFNFKSSVFHPPSV